MAIKDRTKDRTSLIRDLLDPDLDTAEIARRHAVDPAELRAVVRSPAFRTAAAAIHEVDQTRTAALLPAHKARAVRRLATIAAQPAETTAQAESARRAATALIRCKADPLPDHEPTDHPTPGRSAHPTDSPDTPSPTTPPSIPGRRKDHATGCRADGAAFCTSSSPSLQSTKHTPNPAPRTAPPTAQPTHPTSAAAQLRARAGSPNNINARPNPPPQRGGGE